MAKKFLGDEIKRIIKQVRKGHVTDDQALTLIMAEFNEVQIASNREQYETKISDASQIDSAFLANPDPNQTNPPVTPRPDPLPTPQYKAL